MARVHRLTLSNFRNYRAAVLETDAGRSCSTGRTAPARQISSKPFRFSRPAAVFAARRSRRSRSTRATDPGRSRPKSRARSGLPRSAPELSAPRRARPTKLPSSANTGSTANRSLGLGFHRSSQRGLARAVDGFPVRRSTVRSGAAFSTGWRSRSMPSMRAGSTRSIGRCARATGFLPSLDPDSHWLDAVEHETAELAVAVAGTSRRGGASSGTACWRAAGTPISRLSRFRLRVGWSG